MKYIWHRPILQHLVLDPLLNENQPFLQGLGTSVILGQRAPLGRLVRRDLRTAVERHLVPLCHDLGSGPNLQAL